MKEYLPEKVVIVIPSLDPEWTLVTYIKDLLALDLQTIVVVDDGSNVENQYIFDELLKMDVNVLHHSVNQGKGRALKTAFEYVLKNFVGSNIAGVVTADADGQHSAEDTKNVATRLTEKQCLILGTRNFDERQVPFKSRNGNKLTSIVFKLFYGKNIHDTQTGLRGIPISFLPKCTLLKGERFEYETAMLIEAINEDMNIIEEPIQTIYVDSNRATHFSAVRDSFKIYRIILGCFLKYSYTALLSFMIDMGLFALLTKIVFKDCSIELALLFGTILARACSSLFNYAINKNITFNKQKQSANSLIRYYILCIIQALLSWIMVTGIFLIIHAETLFIKIAIDTFLFFISFQIQRIWVFREVK